MSSQAIFYIILSIIIIEFIFDKVIDALNAKHFNDKLPEELKDVYNEDEYLKSQAYNNVNYRFSLLTSLFSFILILGILVFDGFAFFDALARSITNSELLIPLVFFGILMLGSDILFTPLSYYKTFVIEEKFGFNKTTKKTFWLDKIKGWFLTIVIGGLILTAFIIFYQKSGNYFWIYAWILVAAFSIFINMFYSTLIVPLFNKQTPLEDGELKTAIKEFSTKTGFKLTKIFVIDGSKRSTKANAYFSGFGPQKRITLYDTLINDLDTQEIVAVLAHEVGHYKRKHIIFNLIVSILITGFTLYLLSLFINNDALSQALGVKEASFHIGLIAFGILYAPISTITGLIMNHISRKFEYQADNYAKENYDGKPLITSLKKLSKNSLSNLTPHKGYVFVHHSHPTLYQRIINLKK